MATITSFSTLKSAVADWLDDNTISATGGPIDIMVDLAEDRIYRKMRLRFMESATSPAISSGVLSIPSDWLETKQAHVIQGGVSIKLEPKPAEWIYAYYPDRSTSGMPQYIAQEGDNFIFGPYPDSDYTVNLQYYARPTSLSLTNETNWLTSNASDLLLNGVLLQSIGYKGNDERAEYWKMEYDRAEEELKQQMKRERYGGQQSLRITPA